MRKRIITPVSQKASVSSQAWLDMESAAVVEVTSEDTAYPIESALLSGEKQGWRAAKPGTQTIRLIFDEPHNLRRIWLVFDETETRRTQEFLLRWSADTGHSFREIVRQQWNFSPPETVREVEDYAVELSDVRVLELIIVPDKSGSEACASLESLRLA
jgi:nuclear transport factor 2 (NTF2) superfamily protein